MRHLRWITSILLVLAGLDLLATLVVGLSLFGGMTVGLGGFLWRSAAVAILFTLRVTLLAHGPRLNAGRLVLFWLLLPSLAQFQFAGGRINGDGMMYYVFVRSAWKDFDLDLANEYTHYGLITRGDLSMPTKTGLRRSIFSIGPAVVCAPFFWLGEGAARLEDLAGLPADLSGYGPAHRNAVALGGLLYGFAAVLLIHALLRRYFGDATALGASLMIWGATFLHWYMVQQPTYAHAPSACATALTVWLWDRDRGRRDAWGFLLLGLVLGLAMTLRWQSGLFLLLPGLDLLRSLKLDWSWAGRTLAVTGGALVGAFPQMAAWKCLYGEWLLRYPPHGTDFVRLDHPFLMNTLFSSRHGLLSWTPVLWAGYLGFIPLIRRRPALAVPLSIPLVLMTYVNACSGDWWAGGSFSNRRFDGLLALLACGIAAAIEASAAIIRKRPVWAVGALAAPFLIWNVTLAEQKRQGAGQDAERPSFPALVARSAGSISAGLGSPPTWPASWLFALRHHRPPAQYDLLVGRYLFYRQNNLKGHIGLGEPGDEVMLGEGWGPAEREQAVTFRRVQTRARLFASLDTPEPLAIRLRVAVPRPETEVSVYVNGRKAGAFRPPTTWSDQIVRADATYWRRELNEVTIESRDAQLAVDCLDFSRLQGK